MHWVAEPADHRLRPPRTMNDTMQVVQHAVTVPPSSMNGSAGVRHASELAEAAGITVLSRPGFRPASARLAVGERPKAE